MIAPPAQFSVSTVGLALTSIVAVVFPESLVRLPKLSDARRARVCTPYPGWGAAKMLAAKKAGPRKAASFMVTKIEGGW